MSSTGRLTVAVYQCAVGGLDTAARLAALRRALDRTETAEADIVICPELYMSGYNIGAAIERRAEAVDGPFAIAVAELARERGQAILYGYPEIARGRLYNSAACFGPDGKLLANHRKLALPPGMETKYFQTGESLTLFSLGEFRIALLVCYDAEFPELVRRVAIAGAQAVLVPTALKDCWATVAHRMMPTRAFENGIYLVYANHAGRESDITYLGASCIIAPDGDELVRAGADEEMLLASLDIRQVGQARARLPYLQNSVRTRR